IGSQTRLCAVTRTPLLFAVCAALLLVGCGDPSLTGPTAAPPETRPIAASPEPATTAAPVAGVPVESPTPVTPPVWCILTVQGDLVCLPRCTGDPDGERKCVPCAITVH